MNLVRSPTELDFPDTGMDVATEPMELQTPPLARMPAGARDPQTAPGTGIRYTADLVPQLVETHQQLARLMRRLQAGAARQQFEDVNELLGDFKTVMQQHLLDENVRFYTYVSYCLKADSHASVLMTEMRRQMADIGRQITRFIRHWESETVTRENHKLFLGDLEDARRALESRVRREEKSLFALYQPPTSYES